MNILKVGVSYKNTEYDVNNTKMKIDSTERCFKKMYVSQLYLVSLYFIWPTVIYHSNAVKALIYFNDDNSVMQKKKKKKYPLKKNTK